MVDYAMLARAKQWLRVARKRIQVDERAAAIRAALVCRNKAYGRVMYSPSKAIRGAAVLHR